MAYPEKAEPFDFKTFHGLFDLGDVPDNPSEVKIVSSRIVVYGNDRCGAEDFISSLNDYFQSKGINHLEVTRTRYVHNIRKLFFGIDIDAQGKDLGQHTLPRGVFVLTEMKLDIGGMDMNIPTFPESEGMILDYVQHLASQYGVPVVKMDMAKTMEVMRGNIGTLLSLAELG